MTNLTYIPHPTYEDLLSGIIDKVGDVRNLNEAQLMALAKQKIELIRKQRNSPVLFYKPYESRLIPGRSPQDLFHRSLAKIRLFVGGNRSGKSEGGIIEDVWQATGRHPYNQLPIPNHGWIVSLDFPTSRDVAEVKLRHWLPPYEIAKWDNQERVIYLKNGSTIGLRSCDQDIEKFGGAAKHWIHFDEEPPGERGRSIYEECMMRTADYRGRLWFTLTPVSGMSWTYDHLVERALFDKDIFVVEVDSLENPHVPQDELEKIFGKLTPDQVEMRRKGKYIQFSGLVYKELDRRVNIIPPHPIPDSAIRYRSIDHGINNPTACVWAYVNEKNEMYVYDEYYETDKTVKENAEAITSITAGDRIAWTTIDPSTDNRDPINNTSVRKEYLKHGIITRAFRSERMPGINMIKQMLIPNQQTQRPTLFIFDTCHNLIKEFSRYRWKVYKGKEDRNNAEEPVKVMDHALDALRYLVMSKPRFDNYDDLVEVEKPSWY
jgi:phage terminase large subunit-like protein